MLKLPEVRWGLALPAGSAVLFGPAGAVTTVGESWLIHSPESELEPFGEPDGLDSDEVN